MSNVSDYLKWRGDLDFSQAPFNDVDNLILAQIAYVDFTDIVPAPGSIETITIAEAADTFFDTHDEKEIKKCKSFIGKAPYLLREAAATKRFGSLILTNYVDYVDGGKEEQFAAFHVRIDNRLTYIAFRGTDDTLVGWKEDFNMAFRCPVPAQESAARYVDEAADAIDGPLLCGGHSKGGNLAVYGAAMCSDVARARIERAYSHDGPGFVEEFLSGSAFADLSGRIDKTLPRSSIFGMMFEMQEDYAIVESTEFSLLQHNPFSWVVDGRDFVYCERLSAGARYVDGSIREMLLAVSPSERERFVDALFSVFEATGAERFADIAGNLRESLPVMLQAAQGFDKDTRRFVSQTIVAILKCALLPKRPQIDMPAAGKSLAEQLEAWQSELLR